MEEISFNGQSLCTGCEIFADSSTEKEGKCDDRKAVGLAAESGEEYVVLLKCILVSIIGTMSIKTSSKLETFTTLKDACYVTAFFTTIFISCDILLRLGYLSVQLISANTFKDLDFTDALRNTFSFNMASIVLIILNLTLFLLMCVSVHEELINYVWSLNPLTSILCILLSWVLLRVTNFCDWNVQNTFSINSMKGLDYGSGMAYSYYHGYLRIVLPSLGTANKGLAERIQNAEDTHNITFASEKMFVLIPASSYIPPDLKDVSHKWMESAVDLEEEIRDRAGVRGRKYKNNVYKIYPGGQESGSKPMYVVAEGATPMRTLFEIERHSHPESLTYKKYHREIIKAFYEKLKQLLDDDPDCRDLCELVYYEDYDKKYGKVNVAEVILNRITKARKAN